MKKALGWRSLNPTLGQSCPLDQWCRLFSGSPVFICMILHLQLIGNVKSTPTSLLHSKQKHLISKKGKGDRAILCCVWLILLVHSNHQKKKLDGYSVMLVTKFWSNTYTLIRGSAGKESACNTGDLGSIPRLGRSLGKGTGYPLQYSGLENSMDYTVHGRAKGWTRLSNFHFLHKIFKYGYITESFCYTHETNTL